MMSLAKTDKIIAIVAVIILVAAAISIIVYTQTYEEPEKVTVEPKEKTFDVTWSKDTGEMSSIHGEAKKTYEDTINVNIPSSKICVLTNVEITINWEDDHTYGILTKKGLDTLTGENITIKADLVVLALGMIPNLKHDLAAKLKIPQDIYGFAQEVHPKLRPVEISTSGVFIAGAVQGPKDISETVVQASAAAAKALQLLGKEEIVREPLIAEVDEDKCNGCRICASICPYDAITMVNGKAKVNELVCEGCGACEASCPVGAIKLRNYTDEQLLDMVKTVLKVRA